ncbi:acyl-CoA thioesterase [Novosphingobium sp.]|uniref:acyl-CoA thioesterase n=1 Tax=Novosphingobium sp. TaxID=1874826 RepID=UPI0025D02018|nr:acyl-CoA thioesterase [Novosphingobium sp.]
MSCRHAMTFTAAPEHIDVFGHVNNTVWVEWCQTIATAHWTTVASAELQDAFVWLVTRHEIDYRGNIGLGESVEAVTFIPDPPSGARFDRRTDFRNGAGKVIVSARTTWALIDRRSGWLQRVRPDITAMFEPFAES